MAKTRMLWNKMQDASVASSKIRQINIYECRDGYEVFGWFNANEHFNFGVFGTMKQAKDFVDALHAVIAND